MLSHKERVLDCLKVAHHVVWRDSQKDVLGAIRAASTDPEVRAAAITTVSGANDLPGIRGAESLGGVTQSDRVQWLANAITQQKARI